VLSLEQGSWTLRALLAWQPLRPGARFGWSERETDAWLCRAAGNIAERTEDCSPGPAYECAHPAALVPACSHR